MVGVYKITDSKWCLVEGKSREFFDKNVAKYEKLGYTLIPESFVILGEANNPSNYICIMKKKE